MSRNDGGGSDRRTVLQGIGAVLGVSALASTVGADDHDEDDSEGNEDTENHDDAEFRLPEDDGLVTVAGGESVEETASRICGTIRDQEDLMVVAHVDHAENAESVDEELRPTRLLVFGNPRAGTPLMQKSQSVGIDLPQKMLVWEDAEGRVNVTYNDPAFLAARHGIEGQDELLGTIEEVLSMIAEAGSGDGEA